jgi:hypothetical protein
LRDPLRDYRQVLAERLRSLNLMPAGDGNHLVIGIEQV